MSWLEGLLDTKTVGPQLNVGVGSWGMAGRGSTRHTSVAETRSTEDWEQVRTRGQLLGAAPEEGGGPGSQSSGVRKTQCTSLVRSCAQDLEECVWGGLRAL